MLASSEAFRGAAFERVFESMARNRPGRGRNFGIETVDEVRMGSEQARWFGGARGGAVHSARIAT